MPDLHVIAAGSLLEFLLEEEKFSFPVGRVSVLNMGPLSFEEFLLALGQEGLLEVIQQATAQGGIDPIAHKALLERIREYCLVGGMPRIVLQYRKSESYVEAQRYQRALLDLYRLDFGKYARRTQVRPLHRLFERAPELVAKHLLNNL